MPGKRGKRVTAVKGEPTEVKVKTGIIKRVDSRNIAFIPTGRTSGKYFYGTWEQALADKKDMEAFGRNKKNKGEATEEVEDEEE